MLAHWLRSIAADLVVRTAGGDYKPTPTQCLLNVGPVSPVLASIHSALVSTSCWWERVHIRRGALLQTAKWKYLLISQVCILPSFGRAVTGTAADSEMEVSADFTSVHIPSFGRAVTVSTYGLLATLLHAGQTDRTEWDTQTKRTHRLH